MYRTIKNDKIKRKCFRKYLVLSLNNFVQITKSTEIHS